MKTSELEKKFDDGEEDILSSLDISAAKRLNKEQKRVNVDIPIWMIDSLDKEASRIGVTRQSIIKLWLAEKIEVATNKAD
ncbi:MAG: hypothetical protein KTR16_04050 [Acidiferrobacterales bacterium]|nr:hypothetical protein [Acidiferrobacterales bacterium]